MRRRRALRRRQPPARPPSSTAYSPAMTIGECRCRPLAADGVQRRPRYRRASSTPIACSIWAAARTSWSIPSSQRSRGRDVPRRARELTGGRLYEVGRNEDLSATFRAILDEFRYRYLLTYTPKNVAKDGWHKLEVKVNRSGRASESAPWIPGRLSLLRKAQVPDALLIHAEGINRTGRISDERDRADRSAELVGTDRGHLDHRVRARRFSTSAP